MRNYAATAALLLLFVTYAHAEDIDDPEAQARQAHELANTDMIYEPQRTKALYYQNIEIIRLLKDIREELHTLNVRAAKEQHT